MLRQPLDVSVRSLVPGRRSGAEAQVGGPVSEELLSSTAAGFRHDVERCRTLNPRKVGHGTVSGTSPSLSRRATPCCRPRRILICRLLRTCQDFAFRYGVLDTSAGPVGGFLRRRGAARWTSGQPQSGLWCSSWRFPSSPAPHHLHPVHRGVLHLGVSAAVQTDTGTPCCTRSGLVAHVDFGLAFDLRRREVLFRAGFELSESLGG